MPQNPRGGMLSPRWKGAELRTFGVAVLYSKAFAQTNPVLGRVCKRRCGDAGTEIAALPVHHRPRGELPPSGGAAAAPLSIGYAEPYKNLEWGP